MRLSLKVQQGAKGLNEQTVVDMLLRLGIDNLFLIVGMLSIAIYFEVKRHQENRNLEYLVAAREAYLRAAAG